MCGNIDLYCIFFGRPPEKLLKGFDNCRSVCLFIDKKINSILRQSPSLLRKKKVVKLLGITGGVIEVIFLIVEFTDPDHHCIDIA